MQITIFGILILLFAVYQILRNGLGVKTFCSFFALTLFAELNVNKGFFVKVDEFDISCISVLLFLTLVVSLTILKGINFKRNIIPFLLYICSFIFSVLLMVAVPFNGIVLTPGYWDEYFSYQCVKQTYQFNMDGFQYGNFFGFFINAYLILIYLSLNKKYKLLILKKTILFCLVGAIASWIQFLEQNIMLTNNFYGFVKTFFGYSGSDVHDYMYKKMGFYASNGLTTEASFHAYCSVLTIIMVAIYNKNPLSKRHFVYKHRKALYLFVTMSLIFTFSMTALFVGVFLIGWILFCCKRRKCLISKFLYIFSLLALSLFIIVAPVDNMLNSSNEIVFRIGKALNSLMHLSSSDFLTYFSSEFVRFKSIYDSFNDVICHRPLFGLGLSLTNCHSAVVNDLISFGFVGSLLGLIFVADFRIHNHGSVLDANYLLNVIFIAVLIPMLVTKNSVINNLYIATIISASKDIMYAPKNKYIKEHKSVNMRICYAIKK